MTDGRSNTKPENMKMHPTVQQTAPLLTALCLAAAVPAGADDPRALIDPADADVVERTTPSSDQVTVDQTDKPIPGLNVRIAPGDDGYPGILIQPEKDAWDLSDVGHVRARITNTSNHKIPVSLRVDNPGDWRDAPWNTEAIRIQPGKTKAVKVIFGYQYGMKKGFPLDPGKVKQLLVFTTKTKQERSFRIEAVTAGGPPGEKPPVAPQDVRIKPVKGYLLGGSDIDIQPDKQIETPHGGTAEVVAHRGQQRIELSLPSDKSKHVLKVTPPIGRWDLTEACEVRVTMTNTGETALTPGVRVSSGKRHATGTTYAAAPVQPGESSELVRLFEADTPWRGKTGKVTKLHGQGQKGTGTTFASDKADAVHLIIKHEGEATVRVNDIMATAAPVDTPDWLGERPPVDGDWTLTFRDEFAGDTIDRSRWQIYTANYWDKRTHFTKDNLILGDSKVRLRMEKETGRHNDKPDGKVTDYACGHLETYDKWSQRYGYFEARMKLPTAPGLWPAFWMMPDRGNEDWPRWKRSMTEHGGMEFDIMEHLTRWGPYRYNIAMHWDGYGKNHKATGSQAVYVQPDEDGFITSGLLWGPDLAVFYCNGKEVGRWENDRVGSVPMYPILYMVTGGWDNSPLDDEQLPDDFVVDYVRAWQRADWIQETDE